MQQLLRLNMLNCQDSKVLKMTLTEEIEEAAEAEAVEAKAEVAEEASLEAEEVETKVLMSMKTLSQLFERVDTHKVNINNKRASTQCPSCKE